MYFPQSRNQVAEFAPRFVDSSVWVMLVVLAAVLVAVLFVGAGSTILSTTAAAIFSTTVVGSLFLLDEIDSNKIQEAHLEYSIFNETLESLGKIPYIPEFALKKGIVRFPKGKIYRLGKFAKQTGERTIQIINS